MKEELKEKIRASMQEYLVKNGWPDKLKPDHIIMHHLPAMWKKLEAEGLLKEVLSKGFTYKQFVNTAVQAKQREDLRQAFANKMKGFGFR
jgi:hypothetical protein